MTAGAGMPPTDRGGRVVPGGTIGMLGGGQLGRMSGIAARRMGFGVRVFDPEAGGPASQIADAEVVAAWSDTEALQRFADSVDVATIEFENIPAEAARCVAERVALRPGPEVLRTCQNRERERGFLKAKGYPQPEFRIVGSPEELAVALAELGGPSVLKTVESGYDGKGQLKVAPGVDVAAAWREWGGTRGIVEEWIAFELELSVVCARGLDGRAISFPPAENVHTDHILDLSILPGRFEPRVAEEARAIAEGIARDLGVVGLIAVEFFLGRDGKLRVNELAPRPHNSGHYTFDASLTSQFEQHIRAVCGLPLGDPRLLSPAVMVNLLGDLWANGEPDWAGLLADPRVRLHLYGKRAARPGRKMGHFCVVDPARDTALAAARALRAGLRAAAGLPE